MIIDAFVQAVICQLCLVRLTRSSQSTIPTSSTRRSFRQRRLLEVQYLLNVIACWCHSFPVSVAQMLFPFMRFLRDSGIVRRERLDRGSNAAEAALVPAHRARGAESVCWVGACTTFGEVGWKYEPLGLVPFPGLQVRSCRYYIRADNIYIDCASKSWGWKNCIWSKHIILKGSFSVV